MGTCGLPHRACDRGTLPAKAPEGEVRLRPVDRATVLSDHSGSDLTAGSFLVNLGGRQVGHAGLLALKMEVMSPGVLAVSRSRKRQGHGFPQGPQKGHDPANALI